MRSDIRRVLLIDQTVSTCGAVRQRLHKRLVRILIRCPRPLRRPLLKPRPRTRAIIRVTVLHVVLLLFFLLGLHIYVVKPPQVYEMTLGGPVGDSSKANPPEFIEPSLPTVLPPDIPSDMTIDANIGASAAGSPNVTRPAEAISEAHLFPKVPDAFKGMRPQPVRLVLVIAANGQISDAQVQSSCGSAELDAVAVDWVIRHWRYRPAMRNGMAVSENTTAILLFHV